MKKEYRGRFFGPSTTGRNPLQDRDGLTMYPLSAEEWGGYPEQAAYAEQLFRKMSGALDGGNSQEMFDMLLLAMQEAVDAAGEGKITVGQRAYLRNHARSLWSRCEKIAEDIFDGSPTSEQMAKAKYMDIDS